MNKDPYIYRIRSINNTMIDEGYAWEYDGGTKKKDFAELEAKRKK